jgi:hypothetical protein
MTPARAWRFAVQGAERTPAALDADDLAHLEQILDHADAMRPGVRLNGCPGLGEALSASSAPGRTARAVLGMECRPVRAVLFDKTPETNWSLGWHQDRTIVVRERREAPGFGPWSVKQGLQHVAPPFAILAGMATLRIHLDAVDAHNAPLKAAPGSHRLGRIAVEDIPAAVARCGADVCLAERGDIWTYATPILHGSDLSRRAGRRRVLQVDYACEDLPCGLEWLGV